VLIWAEHRPQIVLMDISLPVFHGFEAARLIRQMEETGDGTQYPSEPAALRLLRLKWRAILNVSSVAIWKSARTSAGMTYCSESSRQR
ncbi:hypothetical protein ACC705_34645, partial [Rhizobium ruizarguesonis]